MYTKAHVQPNDLHNQQIMAEKNGWEPRGRRHNSAPSPSKVDLPDIQIDPSYKPKILKHSGQSIDSPEEFTPEEKTYNVLVLYTGGTIGMRADTGGQY